MQHTQRGFWKAMWQLYKIGHALTLRLYSPLFNMAIFSSCLPGVCLGRTVLLLICFTFLIFPFSSSFTCFLGSSSGLAIILAVWDISSSFGKARVLRISCAWRRTAARLKHCSVFFSLLADNVSQKYHAVYVKEHTRLLRHTRTNLFLVLLSSLPPPAHVYKHVCSIKQISLFAHCTWFVQFGSTISRWQNYATWRNLWSFCWKHS